MLIPKPGRRGGRSSCPSRVGLSGKLALVPIAGRLRRDCCRVSSLVHKRGVHLGKEWDELVSEPPVFARVFPSD